MYTSTPCFVSIEREKEEKDLYIFASIFGEARWYRFLYDRDFRHETVKETFAITFEELETVI